MVREFYQLRFLAGMELATRKLAAILCFIAALIATQSWADDSNIVFSVKPDRCIALHQGQVCYQKLKFHWQLPTSGEFCLFQLPQEKPLLCWKAVEQKSFVHEFKSDSSIMYQIRVKNQASSLAAVKVKVAWVYRSSRKSTSGWRLF